MPYRKSLLHAVKFLKPPNIQKKKQEIEKGIENLRSGVKTPSLAQLDKSFKNTKKATLILKQVSDIIIFYKNAIHNNTVKPISGNCCDVSSFLERSHNVANKVKHIFKSLQSNIKSIQLKTFQQLLVKNLAK